MLKKFSVRFISDEGSGVYITIFISIHSVSVSFALNPLADIVGPVGKYMLPDTFFREHFITLEELTQKFIQFDRSFYVSLSTLYYTSGGAPHYSLSIFYGGVSGLRGSVANIFDCTGSFVPDWPSAADANTVCKSVGVCPMLICKN